MRFGKIFQLIKQFVIIFPIGCIFPGISCGKTPDLFNCSALSLNHPPQQAFWIFKTLGFYHRIFQVFGFYFRMSLNLSMKNGWEFSKYGWLLLCPHFCSEYLFLLQKSCNFNNNEKNDNILNMIKDLISFV
jgi:hypothetical protein